MCVCVCTPLWRSLLLRESLDNLYHRQSLVHLLSYHSLFPSMLAQATCISPSVCMSLENIYI